MITFQFTQRFKTTFQKYESQLHTIYEYVHNLFVNANQYNLRVHFDLMTTQHELEQYDAYTTIQSWNENLFPKSSNIYVADTFSSKKHFCYTLLHEILHALGLMYLPTINKRWNRMINAYTKQYIGPSEKQSIAIQYYKKLHAKQAKTIPLFKEINNDTYSDYHHLCKEIHDVFSSPLHYNISPVTLGLLQDYGYDVVKEAFSKKIVYL